MPFGRHRAFADRADAGQRLGEALAPVVAPPTVVLGLPRGGVPVAARVAERLGLPLDVILVRKLGVPGHAELAAGAIGEDGVRVLNQRVLDHVGVDAGDLAPIEAQERIELDRRARRYRGDRPRLDLRGRTALVVDDGVATGSTARVACLVARGHGAVRVHLAVPVSLADLDGALGDVADATTTLWASTGLNAVGQAYRDFTQTTDDEVVALLSRAASGSDP